MTEKAIKPRQSSILQNDQGESSPARFFSLFLLIAAIFTGVITFNLRTKEAGVNITYTLLSASFGIKGFSKYANKSKATNDEV